MKGIYYYEKLSVLMYLLVVAMLFTGIVSADGTYEVVTAIQESDLVPTRLGTSGPISDWQDTDFATSIDAESTISRGIFFSAGLSISIKNEIANFVLGVEYDWEETYGIGVNCSIYSRQGDWARLVGQIYEKK